MQKPLPDLLKMRGLRPIDLAKGLGVDKATVTRWGQKQVPAQRVEQVSKFTGIPPKTLRPDLAGLFRRSRKAEAAT